MRVKEDIIIRRAGAADCKALAALSAQLGYPCKEEAVKERIAGIEAEDERAVLVAETGEQVIGWTTLEVVRHFYLDPCVNLSGFVIDERYRGRGVGRLMIREAENWVREKGLDVLRLNANAVRKNAHRFYENNGFRKVKEQFVYVKNID